MMQNEEKIVQLNKKMEQRMDVLCDKYDGHMQVLESSLLSKAKGGLEIYDYVALGEQLERWDEYKEFCEEEGNLNQLGKLPNIAHSVITVAHGTAIHNILAAVQPVAEERGLIYFEQVRAGTTKGNNTSGDVLIDPRTGLKTSKGFASSSIEAEVLATFATGTPSYTATPAVTPIRSQTLKVYVAGTEFAAEDIGPAENGDKNIGRIWGNKLSGQINYATGAITITFAAEPANGSLVLIDYQQNYEKATDLPQIEFFLDSKQIQADIYALKAVTSMLKNFAIRKRFGMSAEQDLSRKLIQEINRELGGKLVGKLFGAQQGNTIFDKTPPAAVSYIDHKQTLVDKVADAEAVMVGNAGRGNITHMAVGRELAAVISTLPNFNKLSDGTQIGSHIFGTWDGKVIVRVNEQAVLDSKKAVCIYKGASPFEAAAVYSPYMPLAITGTLPLSPNPLTDQKAAAVWAGMDVVMENYITGLEMTIS